MNPYNCPYCGGATQRCAVVHQYCTRCYSCKHCKSSTCKCLQCDITGHLDSVCPGGLECYEKSVFCIVNPDFLKYSDIGDSFYGEYNGDGYVIPEVNSVYNFLDENLEDSQSIPVKIICKSCFVKMKNQEDEIIQMRNDLDNMSIEQKLEYQQFLDDDGSITLTELKKIL